MNEEIATAEVTEVNTGATCNTARDKGLILKGKGLYRLFYLFFLKPTLY